MKITILFCFIIISVGSVSAQEIDNRLLYKYSQNELQTMIDTDTDQYEFLEYALDNAIYVANYDCSKGGNFTSISVDVDAIPSFIELGIDISDRNQYFKIEGEEKLLVVKSAVVLKYEMKKK